MTAVPNCTSAIGTLSYTASNTSVVLFLHQHHRQDGDRHRRAARHHRYYRHRGLSGSSAGYFSTCPPKSISVTLANGETSGTITQGITQNMVTAVTDTNGNPITGLALDYQSTDPIDISVSSQGAITTSYPGVASIYAVCQPSTCNPSPINQVGLYGTGLAVSSNPVTVTVPGTASDYAWFAAPGQSQYFMPVRAALGHRRRPGAPALRAELHGDGPAGQ